MLWLPPGDFCSIILTSRHETAVATHTRSSLKPFLEIAMSNGYWPIISWFPTRYAGRTARQERQRRINELTERCEHLSKNWRLSMQPSGWNASYGKLSPRSWNNLPNRHGSNDFVRFADGGEVAIPRYMAFVLHRRCPVTE